MKMLSSTHSQGTTGFPVMTVAASLPRAADLRDMRLSTMTASRMMAPLIASFQKGDTLARFRELVIVPISTAPRRTPRTEPEPPAMLTPPSTTAVMAMNSNPSAAELSAAARRDAQSTPPAPASAPVSR